MTNREKLQENYEDSVLALLMDEFAESEGQRYIEENDRLRQDPSAAVPEEVEKRALQVIDKAFSRKDRAHASGKILHFLGRLAIAAVIAALLFGAAFALSETVRTGTLNFLMQMDERIATWQFTRDEGAEFSEPSGALEIVIDWLPEGYTTSRYNAITQVDIVVDCTNDSGGLISVSVHESEKGMHYLDLEDADYHTEVVVNDCEGMVIQKGDTLRIYWAYYNTDLVVGLMSDDVDLKNLLKIAEGVSIIG